MSLAANACAPAGSKHIYIRRHYVRELLKAGLNFVRFKSQPGNILTKVVSVNTFSPLLLFVLSHGLGIILARPDTNTKKPRPVHMLHYNSLLLTFLFLIVLRSETECNPWGLPISHILSCQCGSDASKTKVMLRSNYGLSSVFKFPESFTFEER